MAANQDQLHPQAKKDRQLINQLLSEPVNNRSLLDLARLRIRYQNFPGARDIQRDLDLLLKQWRITEEQLFARTRQLYTAGQGYQPRQNSEPSQDWS
ncbi:MAG: DUF3288 family protein [Cyanobacteria bacterium P01_H01_bin.15]